MYKYFPIYSVSYKVKIIEYIKYSIIRCAYPDCFYKIELIIF